MRTEDFKKEIEGIISDDSTLALTVSPDFQCDQTGGFPTTLCVCWSQFKAWIQPSEFVDATPEQFEKAWQDCADYGFRECFNDEDHNNILKDLGEDAYNTAYLPEDEEEYSGLSM